MAPKSWAISHPERTAILLALHMRGFMTITRPILLALNGAANLCLRRAGVEPVDELTSGRDPETLRELVDHSAAAGALDQDHRIQLLTAMELDTAQLSTLLRPHAEVAGVAASDRIDQIREVARRSGHLRLVVWQGPEPVGLVHVRDTLDTAASTTAADIMRPVLILPPTSPSTGPHHHAQTTQPVHPIEDDQGQLLGLAIMQDLLNRLLPST
jgi:CBS domain containing-hemolysin-like protein